MRIGKRIQTLREKQGLTQKELGNLLGVSGSMIGQYENDLRNPKFETLEKIAKALNVSVESLTALPSETSIVESIITQFERQISISLRVIYDELQKIDSALNKLKEYSPTSDREIDTYRQIG